MDKAIRECNNSRATVLILTLIMINQLGISQIGVVQMEERKKRMEGNSKENQRMLIRSQEYLKINLKKIKMHI